MVELDCQSSGMRLMRMVKRMTGRKEEMTWRFEFKMT
jgi:hypothetical protein